MSVKLKKKLGRKSYLGKDRTEKIELVLGLSGDPGGDKTYTSGRRFAEWIMSIFKDRWNNPRYKIIEINDVRTRVDANESSLRDLLANTNYKIRNKVKELILRTKAIPREDAQGKITTPDWGKEGFRKDPRITGRGAPVERPDIIYGRSDYQDGVDIELKDLFTEAKEGKTAAEKRKLDKIYQDLVGRIKTGSRGHDSIRYNFGGFQTKHFAGDSIDIRARDLDSHTIDELRALLGWGAVHPEGDYALMHINHGKLKQYSTDELKRIMNSRQHRDKVAAMKKRRLDAYAAKPNHKDNKYNVQLRDVRAMPKEQRIRVNQGRERKGIGAYYPEGNAQPLPQPQQPRRAAPTPAPGPTARLAGASGAATIRKLYNKARSRTTPRSKKADAYANVIESLRAFEGEKPLFIEKLEEKFSDMTPRTGLGHYVTYFDQGRSWKAPAKEKSEGYTGPDDQSVMVEEKTEGYTGPDDQSVMVEEEIKEYPTVKETVTDQDFEHFNQEGDSPQNKDPVGITATDRKSLEGSNLALGPKAGKIKVEEEEDFTFKGDDPRERIEEQINLREKLYESPSGLSPAQTAANPTPEAKGMPQDMLVDYKIRQNTKGFNEGGSVLREPELSEDEEIAARQTGDTDIVSEAIEDKVEGTVPQDSWRLKPKEPKPPREPILTKEGVSMVKQQETGDTSKMSTEEVKEKLKETKEVVSEPGSDTVTLKTRPTQIRRNKELRESLVEKERLIEAGPPDEVGIREAQKLGITHPDQQIKDEKITATVTEEPVDDDPKAFDLQTYIQQLVQGDDEAREIMRNELSKANEAELNIQKVEPFRFWNTMSTPAKIVAGIGMLIGGYAAKDSPAGLQAVMNVIDGAVNADIQAQKLTQEQQLVVAKESTRRAKAAVDKYKAVATSPIQRAKLMELAQALEVKKAGIAKKQQLQALKTYVMNQARAGKLHLVPPALMRMVYPKEEMKRIDTMRANFEKERKERKLQPVISAYRRMHNLIAKKDDITGMDDIAIVFSFMKQLDPGSVVRESEFETAANAGPRAKWFARQWNRFITGERFTQADRDGFLRAALKLVKPAMDEEKELQRKYISMARRYGYPSAFIISPSTRYFDLPGTKDDAAVRRIMKEEGKTREEAEDIHHYVVHGVKSKRQLKREKPVYYSHKGVKYKAR